MWLIGELDVHSGGDLHVCPMPRDDGELAVNKAIIILVLRDAVCQAATACGEAEMATSCRTASQDAS